MPSKLQAYLQQYRNDHTRNIKLPSIYSSPIMEDKLKLINANQLKQKRKQQNQQTKLTYSKDKHTQRPIQKNKNRQKRLHTQQQSISDYKKLNQIEQNIISQIKNIDICLQSQRNHHKDKFRTSLFQGHIFLNEVNQFVIDKFYDCLKIQAQASTAIVQGFQIPKYILGPNGQPNIVQAHIIKKAPTINNKLLNKSIIAIQEYDNKKNHQYQKNCGKQWSLYKRGNPQKVKDIVIVSQKGLSSGGGGKNQSKLSFVKSFSKRNQSQSTKLFESKLTVNSKHTFINQFEFMKKTKDSKATKISKNYSIKTQPSVFQQQLQQTIVNLTKKDVKMMLYRHKNVISIWLPPASYPQFFGIFTYKIIKHQNPQTINSTICKCKINRYFFYKFGLNRNVFDGILEWVIHQNNILVNSLEITLQKSQYSKVFSKIGWKLKFWQSADKIKASYQKSIS